MGKYLPPEHRQPLIMTGWRIRAIVGSKRPCKSKIAALFRISDRMEATAESLCRIRDHAPARLAVGLTDAAHEYHRMGGMAVDCALMLDPGRAICTMRRRLGLRRERRRLVANSDDAAQQLCSRRLDHFYLSDSA